MTLFFALLIGHALCDYPLQGDFIGKFKSHKVPSPLPSGEKIWWILLSAHCLIHAGAVWLITGVWWLGLCEFVMHWITDWFKSEGTTNFKFDQGFHVYCKICWAWFFYIAYR